MIPSSSARRAVLASTSKKAPQFLEPAIELEKAVCQWHGTFLWRMGGYETSRPPLPSGERLSLSGISAVRPGFSTPGRCSALEQLLSPGQDFVQRLRPEGRAVGHLSAHLLDVLEPALLDLVLEQLR